MKYIAISFLLFPIWAEASSCRDLSVSDDHTAKAWVQRISANTRTESEYHHIPFKPYLQAIDEISKRDPIFARINDLFSQRKFTFAVDIPKSSHRMDVLKQGILNQYQTETSEGVVNFEKRNFVESRYVRMSDTEYEGVPVELKPKSMYLVPDLQAGVNFTFTQFSERRFMEGSVGDTWVLDLDRIESNTLFVTGDTLDRALIERDLVDNFKTFTLDYSKKMDGSSSLDYLLPLDWVKATIPFYYERMLNRNEMRYVDPATQKQMYEDYKKEMGVVPLWMESRIITSRPQFDDAFYQKFPELKRYDQNLMGRPYGNYSEGLYFGPLSPDKIKALIFHDTPPSSSELRELRRLGIKIYDARSGAPREWTEAVDNQ